MARCERVCRRIAFCKFDAVSFSKRQVVMNYITEYRLDWPRRFERIARFLGEVLPGACRIHHAGSTAIPGMPAKDIIDIDIEYPGKMLPTLIAVLNASGYLHEGDKGIPGRESFRHMPKDAAARLPRHHLYACESGGGELARHLAFRDYLIHHGQRAQWLASEKISSDALAVSREEYIRAKAAAYAVVTEEALGWAGTPALDSRPGSL